MNPRRKYWLALPLPECCAATMPGTASSSSATRNNGRTSRSDPLIVPSLADCAVPILSSPRPKTTMSLGLASSADGVAGLLCATAGGAAIWSRTQGATVASARRIDGFKKHTLQDGSGPLTPSFGRQWIRSLWTRAF
ncbi:hypothetical protein SPHINGO391_350440 [Sphingomonas aurantiaca]|uniref:Uncharacterized protein n=1 Tax=Sphingomonas aurantiaca TaxID=185949 RepID=A0A5E7YED7_9SPHN|nr:hypothetical protein SPHINGO391_350440 [Sphingomonas aurantiaca]